MWVEIKLLGDASLPTKATEDAAGFDLCASSDVIVHRGEVCLIKTGIALAMPPGYEGQIRCRSGLALKKGMFLVNGVGTIDADYRGEVGVIASTFKESFQIKKGDRIAQIVFNKLPDVILLDVKDSALSPTTSDRKGGYGSTGL